MTEGRRDAREGAAAPEPSTPAVLQGEGGGYGTERGARPSSPAQARPGAGGGGARRGLGYGADRGPEPSARPRPRLRPRPVDLRPGRLGGALVFPSGSVPAVSVPEPAAPARRRRIGFGRRPEPVPEVPAPTHGGWTTPTVIVRRPDGSVVEPRRDAARASADARPPVATPAPPRRVPVGRRGLRRRPVPAPAPPAEARAGAVPGPAKARPGRSAVPAYGGARRSSPVDAHPVPQVTATASGAAGRKATAPGTAAATGADGSADAVPARGAGGVAARAPADRRAPVAAPDAPAEPATADDAPTAPEAAGRKVAGSVQLSFDDVGDDEEDAGGENDSGRTPVVLRPLAGVGGRASSAGAGFMDALRVARDAGTSRLLPSDPEARDALNARLRRAGSYIGAVAVACVLIYAVFPVRTYLDQRAATRRAQEQIEVISEQNDKLEDRVAALGTDDEVERIAREDYGMVLPGEESYGILPPPDPSPSTATTTTTAPPTTAPSSAPVTPSAGG